MHTHQVILTILSVAVIACSEPDTSDGVAAFDEGVTEIDLGSVGSTPVTLDIPPNALGFQVIVEVDDSNGTETVGIRTITNPLGAAAVADATPVGAGYPFAATEYGIATTSVPMTAATMPVEPGEWTLDFLVPAGRSAHARALVRTTVDGEFHGGSLDIRVYIPDGLMIADPQPAHAITAATAASDPCVIARIDSFFTTLEQLYDLDRGTVEFVALDGDLRLISDHAARLRALNATTGGGLAAQYILSNELTLEGFKFWGNSAWTPGVATELGHSLSGIVVNISTGLPATADGMTMVHELGHFMGLFHTTEGNRLYHDSLTDTPECEVGASSCPDGNNIMYAGFYGATGGVGLTASDQQRSVVWGSPLYTASP